MSEEAGCSMITTRRALRVHDFRSRPPKKHQGSLEEVLTPEYLHETYLEAHMTMQQIAVEVGCSVGAVSRWLHRHGIPTRRTRPGIDNLLYTDVLNEEHVTQRLEQGASLASLAREAGSTIPAAALAVRRAGVAHLVHEGRRPEAPAAPADVLLALYETEGLSLEAMAQRLGVSRLKVRADLDRFGIRPYQRPKVSPFARAQRRPPAAIFVLPPCRCSKTQRSRTRRTAPHNSFARFAVFCARIRRQRNSCPFGVSAAIFQKLVDAMMRSEP